MRKPRLFIGIMEGSHLGFSKLVVEDAASVLDQLIPYGNNCLSKLGRRYSKELRRVEAANVSVVFQFVICR